MKLFRISPFLLKIIGFEIVTPSEWLSQDLRLRSGAGLGSRNQRFLELVTEHLQRGV